MRALYLVRKSCCGGFCQKLSILLANSMPCRHVVLDQLEHGVYVATQLALVPSCSSARRTLLACLLLLA